MFAAITEKKNKFHFQQFGCFCVKLLSVYLIEKPSDSSFIKQIKQVVKSDLEDRYSDSHLMMLLNKACFLDPRFKSLSFLSEKIEKMLFVLLKRKQHA